MKRVEFLNFVSCPPSSLASEQEALLIDVVMRAARSESLLEDHEQLENYSVRETMFH